jgi:hypothetical protein
MLDSRYALPYVLNKIASLIWDEMGMSAGRRPKMPETNTPPSTVLLLKIRY